MLKTVRHGRESIAHMQTAEPPCRQPDYQTLAEFCLCLAEAAALKNFQPDALLLHAFDRQGRHMAFQWNCTTEEHLKLLALARAAVKAEA